MTRSTAVTVPDLPLRPRCAVLALHLQNDVLHADGRIPFGTGDDARRRATIDAAARLLAGARAAAVPVWSVRIAFRADGSDLIDNAPLFARVRAERAVVDGTWGADFLDGLGPAAGEAVITHTRVNPFLDTPLDPQLRARDIAHLVVAGVATHSVVEHTVRHAVDLGYRVAVAADACSSAHPATHAASLASMALLARIATVADVLQAWQA
ncbi:MAG: cysteine hydrolase [Burkholderiales bacterium]|jgi:nicotinamidase-related amidase|nr:cysteine hydrolase [Burkholderiales bacterium]